MAFCSPLYFCHNNSALAYLNCFDSKIDLAINVPLLVKALAPQPTIEPMIRADDRYTSSKRS